MSSLARVREVYERVVDLAGVERDRALRAVCGDDEQLRKDVEALLRAGTDAGSFLEEPPTAVGLADITSIAGVEWLAFRNGDKFGQFTLVEVLGQGGMGVVYKAEQERPKRVVAIKMIRSPFLSPQLLRRFEQEAQVLGLLRHPGIAQIYEAGTVVGTDGRQQPYYAMELVQGRPLIAFANGQGLCVRDRLQLFALVCDAVQHAHQKGVIHRDLKPANILVEAGDASSATTSGTSSTTSGPQPKILDFGVARITGSDIALTTAGTDVGQLVGTLPYMSPEQVRGEVGGIDTRSDVYALGVVLFELMTGRLPYDVKGKTIAAAAMTITNEEPTSPGRLSPGLRGDVETILLKALEKVPDRRYQSAAELAADVRRHLADMPIVARPATTAYHVRKFARRNKALVGGVIAAFLLLVAGVVGTSIGLVRAKKSQRLAEQRESEARVAAKTAENSEQFLISMLSAANPLVSRNRELTVRELLDEAALKVESQLSEEPAVAMRTRLALAKTYLSIAAFDQSAAQTDAAEALAVSHFGEESVEHSLVLAQRCEYYSARNLITEGIPVAQRCLDMRQALLPADNILIPRAEYMLGRMLSGAAKFSDGLPHMRRAVVLMEPHGGTEPITYASDLASMLYRTRDEKSRAEASALLDATVPKARALGPKGGAVTASVLLNCVDFNISMDKAGLAKEQALEAIALREKIFPPNHPSLLFARMPLLRALRANHEYAEARRVADGLVGPIESVMGANAPMLGDVHRERAYACLELPDLDCALQSAQSAVASLTDRTPFVFQTTAYSILISVYMERKEWAKAVDNCDHVLAMAKSKGVPMQIVHPSALTRVKALHADGRSAEALIAADETMAALPEGDSAIRARLETLSVKALVLDSLKRHDESVTLLHSVIEQVTPMDDEWSVELYEQLARSHTAAGEVREASKATAEAANFRARLTH